MTSLPNLREHHRSFLLILTTNQFEMKIRKLGAINKGTKKSIFMHENGSTSLHFDWF